MGRVIGGIFLVAGTAIGAGMLALPVVTAAGGFFPALCIYFLCWLFMTCTGLLFLEICLKLPPDANIVTMATKYLGKVGAYIAWALYLFLFYCLSMAYIAGGGGLLQSTGWLQDWQGQLVFLFLLAPVVYRGARAVDLLNSLLMVGLIGTYCAFVMFGLPHVDADKLAFSDWSASFFALPVIFTSFSYQGIVPSLTAYLHRDAKKVRLAIIGGTSIAFVIYLLWEWIILGIVPIGGEQGLLQAKELGQTAITPLKYHLASDTIPLIGQAFAFFAIATSFLGVTLGLFDFLADSLQMAKKGFMKGVLSLLTFGPPLLVALIKPHIFIMALVFAGGIGCALLLGLFPILMAWVSRYRHVGYDGPRQLFGGKAMLLLLMLFVVFELFIESKLIIR